MNATESDRIELGDNHSAVLRYVDGELWGLAYDHLKPDGTPCITASWVSFEGVGVHASLPGGWTLHSTEPLHIEPSILCTICHDHGFIRDGKWVRA